MQVENINPNINFNAKIQRFNHNFIPKVGRFSEITGKYEPCKVNCLIVDDKSIGDVSALYEISKEWQYLDNSPVLANFTPNIYHIVAEKYKGNDYYRNIKTFLLTEQADNFEHLNDKKILSIACVEETIPNILGHIKYIQGNPEYTYKKNSTYKGVGSTLLDTLKEMYNHITLKSEKSYSVKQFYRKNNFIEEPKNSCSFKWSRDIFSILGIGKNCK